MQFNGLHAHATDLRAGPPGHENDTGGRRLFEVEPLECPRCGQTMRIVASITEPQAIDRILDHVRRTAAARCRLRAPPRAARRVHATAGSTSA